eukprot:1833055-Amphidinium_carterae.1
MFRLLDTIPLMLAKWAEGCECHERWLCSSSPHSCALLLEKHYGKGVTSCPLAGMRAPELAAGQLDHVAKRTWHDHVTMKLSSTAFQHCGLHRRYWMLSWSYCSVITMQAKTGCARLWT